MKSLTNINARSIPDAIQAAQQAIADGNRIAFSGGGTDLLQQLKDGTDLADVIINLRNVEDARSVVSSGADISIGGLIT
ncbi:MAG: FAD binding domain-containing protein, partial [Pseudohongiellaceae bacterium]